MPQLIFRNSRLLDPSHDALLDGHELLIEGGTIREVSDRPIRSEGAEVIDCGGRTLMPGLIDCHVHVVLCDISIPSLESMPLTLMTAHAMRSMRGMIDRGFTTVRDTGGADWGLKAAADRGLFPAPRLFIAGRALGPTGGHGDPRRRTDVGLRCHCCSAMNFVMETADGVAEVQKAVREQLRQGCDQVKIMMSGGVASPFDPLDSLQFSLPEIRAAVEEATAFGRYVCAHAYTPEAIQRACDCGVRTIEHGNLIDAPRARLMAEKGMFLIPNLIAYYAMKERAAEFGMSGEMLEKNDLVIDGGLKSLEICKAAGVKVAFGSDLLGQLQVDQSREFEIRARVLSPLEIIRSATLIGAEVLRQEGRLGCLAPGAHADLLLVDGDPLSDVTVLGGQGERLAMIMKGGAIHKRTLH